MQNIGEIPTENKALALLEIKKSAIFTKIPTEQLDMYIKFSLDYGSQVAESFKNVTLSELFERYNIQLIKKNQRSVARNFFLRGEVYFSNKKSSITIYEDSLSTLARDSSEILPPHYQLSKEKIIDVHLAHEFFHFNEFYTKKVVSDLLPKVAIGGFFGKKRYSSVIQCSEIAAHSFAMSYCELAVLPNFYDFVYLKRLENTALQKNI